MYTTTDDNKWYREYAPWPARGWSLNMPGGWNNIGACPGGSPQEVGGGGGGGGGSRYNIRLSRGAYIYIYTQGEVCLSSE